MFLFIFESIGTSELLLIGVVALIIFGPRKLPQMAKTIGKTMAEFKNATNEFKATWEKEANFEEIEKNITPSSESQNVIFNADNSNSLNSQPKEESAFPNPTIRELSASDIAEKFHNEDRIIPAPKIENVVEKSNSSKQDWL